MALTERAQSEPERIERFFATPEVVRAITAEMMMATAARYLSPDAAVEVHVVPGPDAKAAAKGETEALEVTTD